MNDLLSTGEISDLFPDDEVENIINGVRNEVKGAGLMDSRETCWRFFIDRVRKNLKVELNILEVALSIKITKNLIYFNIRHTLIFLSCV